ncbi:unnamed protein product, partial [Meganyctiphanes norvegica]
FDEIIELLNEMHEGDIQEFRRELQESPPQVLAFGGFSVNYSMMTAVMAFMLSIVSITGMIWTEVGDTKVCYEYQGQGGEWSGENNQTLCFQKDDQINENLFING